MSSESDQPLSRREREIMDVVYAKGEVTALDVTGQLAGSPSKTTVRTLLRILETKGHLKHHKKGQTYYYQATRPRSVAGKSALRRVLETFYDNSIEKAVAAHLSDAHVDMTDEQLQRLRQMIDAASEDRLQ